MPETSDSLDEKLATLQPGEALAETTARIVCQALHCSLAEICEASGLGVNTGVLTVVENDQRTVNRTFQQQWNLILDQRDTIADDMQDSNPRDLSQNHKPKLKCDSNLRVKNQRTRTYRPSKKG